MRLLRGADLQSLAGIRPSFDGPGFKSFTVEPHLPADLDHAEFRYRSPHGDIGSGWRRKITRRALPSRFRPTRNATSSSLPPRKRESPEAESRWIRRHSLASRTEPTVAFIWSFPPCGCGAQAGHIGRFAWLNGLDAVPVGALELKLCVAEVVEVPL
jgi:hypothetical protein